jgi:Tol biopolymer transport system component
MPFDFSYQTIHWTPDGKAIVFIKGENGVFNLWQQPLAGDAPQPLTNFSSGAIWNFTYSQDRKRIFLSRGPSFVDIVLIKNFR